MIFMGFPESLEIWAMGAALAQDDSIATYAEAVLHEGGY
jgi:hypothetical protein